MGFECYNSEEGPRHEDEGEGDLKAPNVLYQSTANNEFLIAQAETLLKKNAIYHKIEALLCRDSWMGRGGCSQRGKGEESVELDEALCGHERDLVVGSLRFLCAFYGLSPQVFSIATCLFDCLVHRLHILPKFYNIIHLSCFYISLHYCSQSHLVPFDDVIRLTQSDATMVQSTTSLILFNLQYSDLPTPLSYLTLFLQLLLFHHPSLLQQMCQEANDLLETLLCHHSFTKHRLDTLVLACCQGVLKPHLTLQQLHEGLAELQVFCQISAESYSACLRDIELFCTSYNQPSHPSTNPNLKLVWTVSKKLLTKMRPSSRAPSCLEPLVEEEEEEKEVEKVEVKGEGEKKKEKGKDEKKEEEPASGNGVMESEEEDGREVAVDGACVEEVVGLHAIIPPLLRAARNGKDEEELKDDAIEIKSPPGSFSTCDSLHSITTDLYADHSFTQNDNNQLEAHCGNNNNVIVTDDGDNNNDITGQGEDEHDDKTGGADELLDSDGPVVDCNKASTKKACNEGSPECQSGGGDEGQNVSVECEVRAVHEEVSEAATKGHGSEEACDGESLTKSHLKSDTQADKQVDKVCQSIKQQNSSPRLSCFMLLDCCIVGINQEDNNNNDDVGKKANKLDVPHNHLDKGNKQVSEYSGNVVCGGWSDGVLLLLTPVHLLEATVVVTKETSEAAVVVEERSKRRRRRKRNKNKHNNKTSNK